MGAANLKRGISRAAAALAVLGLVLVVAVPRRVRVEAAAVERRDFHEILRSDGYLRSKHRVIVTAFADGDIRRVDLKAGDPVKKGGLITRLYWDVSWDPLRAPLSGVVSKVFRESAGPIRRGEPILEIIDPTRLEVVAELLTTDAVRVQVGDRAAIEEWGGGAPFEARVIRVSRAGFTKPSALGVEEERTEVVLDPRGLAPPLSRKLGSGFHVEVAIELAVHPDALVIPSGAVFRDGDRWAVYRIESGRARKAPVEIGARSAQDVLVSSGLSRGEQVIVFPGDLVEDGTRVEAGLD